jgi:Ca-activated chloride channel family protein
VAAFGMLLRESEYVKDFSYDQVVQLAQGSKGEDKEGYRIEFINMVKSFGAVASR